MDPDFVKLEMAYTTYPGSCRDKTIIADNELVECRRAPGHEPDQHACLGNGPAGLLVWGDAAA